MLLTLKVLIRCAGLLEREDLVNDGLEAGRVDQADERLESADAIVCECEEPGGDGETYWVREPMRMPRTTAPLPRMTPGRLDVSAPY